MTSVIAAQLQNRFGAMHRRPDSYTSDSASVAVGTALSRITGLARILVIPAIFGATPLGDVFLAVNALPQTIVAMIGGQALGSVLVPVLVRALQKDRRRADLIGRCALGAVTVALAGVVLVGYVFHRAIATGLTAGIDSQTGAISIARILLIMMIPQVILYGWVAVFIAFQHSRGKFLLASAAPTIENLALIAALIAMAVTFDDLPRAGGNDTMILLALGGASTLALLLHVIVQAIGAARAGAALGFSRPRNAGELTAQRKPLLSSFAWTMTFGLRIVALIVAAGYAGSGGIQAFQIGFLIQNLPMALIGYPVAAAILPRLAKRLPGSQAIAHAYGTARDLVLWILVPTAIGLVVLSPTLGQTLSVGRFAAGNGPQLVAAAIAGLAISAASEAVYEIARQATLAHGTITAFTRSIWVRTAISLAGISLAPVLFSGPSLLLALGLFVSLSDLTALAMIDRSLRQLAKTNQSIVSSLAKSAAAASVAAAICLAAQSLIGIPSPILRLLALSVVYATTYLLAGWVLTGRGSELRKSILYVREAVG